MPNLLLYSTNVFMKLLIQQKFFGDVHYVWCSEQFDSKAFSPHTSAGLVPASSNPADILRLLLRDVQTPDHHSGKIAEQKASLTKRAIALEKAGSITKAVKEEIVYLVKTAAISQWRPLLYVIPRPPVEPRLKLVPAKLRAGIADEFIIPDLQRNEFDIIDIHNA